MSVVAKGSTPVRTPPALSPEQPAVVQPWKDYLGRGLVKSISAIFTPTGHKLEIVLSERVPLPEGVSGALPAGYARDIIMQSGLAGKPAKAKTADGKETVQPLPLRSLCSRDAENPDTIGKRVVEVALKLTTTSALGRIPSLKMNIDGVSKMSDWWAKSSGEQKLRLMTDAKVIASMSDQQKQTLMLSLKKVPCPFRDSETKQPVAKPAAKAKSTEKANEGGKTASGAKPGAVVPHGAAATTVVKTVMAQQASKPSAALGQAGGGAGQSRPGSSSGVKPAGSPATSRTASPAPHGAAGTTVHKKNT